MTNTRIGERLAKLGEPNLEDRSKELPVLTEKFQNFAKGFKPLTDTLKQHYDAMKTLQQTQAKVIDHLAEWSKNSPLAEGEDVKVANVQRSLLKKKQEYSEHFMNDVVAYVHEWEIVVTTRIDTGLKQVKELRQNLDHYQKKVGSLQKQHNAVLSREKVPDAKATDKLQRNDEKLVIAQNEYSFHVTKLCNLIDEAVECCWKDLHPLIFRMMSLESDYLGDEAAIMAASGVVERLKSIAEAYDIDLTKPPPEEKRPSSQEAESAPSEGEKENAPTEEQPDTDKAKERGAAVQEEDENQKATVSTKIKEKGAPLKQEKGHSLTDEEDKPTKAAEYPSKAKERGEPLNEV